VIGEVAALSEKLAWFSAQVESVTP
jgi:hypothetical protein